MKSKIWHLSDDVWAGIKHLTFRSTLRLQENNPFIHRLGSLRDNKIPFLFTVQVFNQINLTLWCFQLQLPVEWGPSSMQVKGRRTFNPQEVTEQEYSNWRKLLQVFEAIINLWEESFKFFEGANFGALKRFRRVNWTGMKYAKEEVLSWGAATGGRFGKSEEERSLDQGAGGKTHPSTLEWRNPVVSTVMRRWGNDLGG